MEKLSIENLGLTELKDSELAEVTGGSFLAFGIGILIGLGIAWLVNR